MVPLACILVLILLGLSLSHSHALGITDPQAAIAADIALASRDGEWLASYGEGALRVYSARDAGGFSGL